MVQNFRWPAVAAVALLAGVSACDKSSKSGDAGKTANGVESAKEGQVIARVGGEEITVHQLNSELASVPRAAIQDPKQFQRAVLRAIVFRTAMRQAALKDKLDRDPQVALLRKASDDKLLADVYLKKETGSTPPPTVTDVDTFVLQHPLMFDDRRMYQFTRMSIAADQYSDLMVPLFDEKETFTELQAYLNEKAIPYTTTDVRASSSEFPQNVQDQLAHFKTGDNVVVKAQNETVILKIKSWTPAPMAREQAREQAQNMLFQQLVQKRAFSIQEALPQTAKIEFYGPFAGMVFIEKPAAQAKPPGAAPSTPVAPAPGGKKP